MANYWKQIEICTIAKGFLICKMNKTNSLELIDLSPLYSTYFLSWILEYKAITQYVAHMKRLHKFFYFNPLLSWLSLSVYLIFKIHHFSSRKKNTKRSLNPNFTNKNKSCCLLVANLFKNFLRGGVKFKFCYLNHL